MSHQHGDVDVNQKGEPKVGGASSAKVSHTLQTYFLVLFCFSNGGDMFIFVLGQLKRDRKHGESRTGKGMKQRLEAWS